MFTSSKIDSSKDNINNSFFPKVGHSGNTGIIGGGLSSTSSRHDTNSNHDRHGSFGKTKEDLLKAIDEQEEQEIRQSISQSFSRRNHNKSMDHSKSFNEVREKMKKSLNLAA